MGLPNIDIIFKQKAVTAVKRSQRGVACIILKDSTQTAAGYDVFKFEADITTDKYSAANIEILKRCFYIAVNKLYVVHVPENTSDFSTIKPILDKIKYNYVCTTIADLQDELVSYNRSRNQTSKGKKYIVVAHDVAVADDKFIIRTKNPTAIDATTGKTVPMTDYLPRITSLLANLPMNRSATYIVARLSRPKSINF